MRIPMIGGPQIAGLAIALALAGCTTTPESQVTRFHLGQPIARGQLAVEPLLPADRGSAEFQTYGDIVGGELARLGFTEAPGLAASEQVAVVGVERGTREALARRSPVTVSIGGGSFGWGGGVGGGVSFPVGGSRRGNEIVVTRLFVQIKRRSDATVIWEGRAETAANTGSAEAQPADSVRRLASAMFRDFPGQTGQTITVK
jgi:hypothetical protein